MRCLALIALLAAVCAAFPGMHMRGAPHKGDKGVERVTCADNFCYANCTSTDIVPDTCNDATEVSCVDSNATEICAGFMRYNDSMCTKPAGIQASVCDKCYNNSGSFGVLHGCNNPLGATFYYECDATCATCSKQMDVWKFTCLQDPWSMTMVEAVDFWPCHKFVQFTTFDDTHCTVKKSASKVIDKACYTVDSGFPGINSVMYRCKSS